MGFFVYAAARETLCLLHFAPAGRASFVVIYVGGRAEIFLATCKTRRCLNSDGVLVCFIRGIGGGNFGVWRRDGNTAAMLAQCNREEDRKNIYISRG